MSPRPSFQPYQEGEGDTYQRNLPHWHQEGVTYFVTFRLADALPASVLEKWDEEKRTWLAVFGVNYSPRSSNWFTEFEEKLSAAQQFQFRRSFNRKLNAELDRGRGGCSLRQDPCLGIVRERLLTGDREGYHLGDFVIMPNHVHLLVMPKPGESLSNVMHWIKGGSARECNRALGSSGRYWQKESYDHIVRDSRELTRFRKYIRENPEKAGIEIPNEAIYEAEWLRT